MRLILTALVLTTLVGCGGVARVAVSAVSRTAARTATTTAARTSITTSTRMATRASIPAMRPPAIRPGVVLPVTEKSGSAVKPWWHEVGLNLGQEAAQKGVEGLLQPSDSKEKRGIDPSRKSGFSTGRRSQR